LAGYLRGMRVAASWGATRITPENHQQASFDLRVVVVLTVADKGLTGEVARLQGQESQS